MTERNIGKGTQLVEGGRRKSWRGRLVNPQVERASTILFDSTADMESGRPALPLMARIDVVARREREPSRCHPPRNSRTTAPSDHATICFA